MAVQVKRPWEFMAKGLDFGLGLWRLHTMPGRRLHFLYFIGYVFSAHFFRLSAKFGHSIPRPSYACMKDFFIRLGSDEYRVYTHMQQFFEVHGTKKGTNPQHPRTQSTLFSSPNLVASGVHKCGVGNGSSLSTHISIEDDQCSGRFLGIIGRDPSWFASPTAYTLTPSDFPLQNWGIFYKIPLK